MLCLWTRRLIPSVLLGVLFLSHPLLGQATVQQYFDQVDGYRIDLLTESSGQEGNFDSPFSAQIIDEFILLHYSRWRVRASAPPSPSSLEVEIFEMHDPQGAFGLFSNWNHLYSELSPQRLNLPVDNYYLNESLVFWRGTYVFHVKGEPQVSVPLSHLEEFSGRLIQALPLLNLHPLTVIHLPKENLVPETIRFYLGEASFALNRHFPQELISSLGFEHPIEVTAARYSPGDPYLYLIGYPTPALAVEYSTILQNAMESYFSPEGVYLRRSGVIISMLFGPESAAQKILPQVTYAPSIQWIYQKQVDPEIRRQETVTFLESVAGTLTLILFFLPFVLVTGVAAGGLRYALFQSFPRVREAGEMVHLTLDE
ncbi:MAG: DUF6599 family protein [Acidobacteriota bacterium]